MTMTTPTLVSPTQVLIERYAPSGIGYGIYVDRETIAVPSRWYDHRDHLEMIHYHLDDACVWWAFERFHQNVWFDARVTDPDQLEVLLCFADTNAAAAFMARWG